jgi:CHAD domain-containing protein
VFCTETAASLRAGFAPDSAVEKLLAAAERRRTAARAALRAFLAGPGYRKLGIRLAGLGLPESWEEAAAGPIAGEALPGFAAETLDRRRRKLVEAGEEIGHLEPATLHRIRLRGKRMRYAAELFAPLWPGKGRRRFIRRLAALQASLGALNDGAVATALRAELAGGGAERAFAVGVVRGFVAGRGAAQREEITAAWRRFRRAEPFWGGG